MKTEIIKKIFSNSNLTIDNVIVKKLNKSGMVWVEFPEHEYLVVSKQFAHRHFNNKSLIAATCQTQYHYIFEEDCDAVTVMKCHPELFNS